MKKRIVALCLLIALFAPILPLPAQATSVASGTCGQQISWELDDMGTLTLTGEGPMNDYGLFGPEWQGNYTYSLQDQPWANIREQIQSIVIGDGITYIGDTAFASCKNLVSIKFPKSLSRIGDAAFSNCSLLEEVTLPDGIKSIELLAFFSSGLKTVTIPSSLENISESAFEACDNISSVYYSGSETDWKNISIADDNWPLVNADMIYAQEGQVDTTVLDSGECGDNVTWILTSDGVLTISGYGELEGWGNYKKIPWYNYADQIFTVNIKKGVTKVSQCSFAGCSYIERVSLPDTITRISSGGFSACKKLKTVTIPDGVKSIGDRAFRGCSALTAVTIPASVTSISFGAFEYCDSLTDVYYGGSESEWGNIKIYRDNECLTDATIHFDSQGSVSAESESTTAHSDNNKKRLVQVNVTYSDDTTGNTQFTYNEQGAITETNMVSPYFSEVQKTVYTYDASGRLTSVQVMSDEWDAIGPKAEYIYDSNGLLVESSRAEGSRVTQFFENDSNGRCVRSSSEGEGVSNKSVYSYNADATQKDEVLTRTDYEGNVTTDYISYFYDDIGNITREVCSGAYWSYMRQYVYNYKPFVAVSEDNKMPYRIYIPDVMGKPIWEIEYMMVATMQNDSDGYLNRIITDSGDTYDFIYETIETAKVDPPDTENISNYHFKLYSPNQELTVEKGKYMQIICALYDGNQLVEKWKKPEISVGNTDVISYSACNKVDNGYCITLQGQKEGTTTLSLYDKNTGTNLNVLVNVVDEYSPVYSYVLNNVPEGYPDSFWDREVKTNFYNFNGLYVTGIDNNIQPDNGEYHLSFNVYNTRYMHGSVDVYNADAKWIKSVCIEKNAGIRTPWDAIEDGFYALCDIIEWNGSYTTSYTSQETVVNIDVPEGGYFVITNNITKSPAVFLYNSLDFVIWAANKAIDAGIETEAIKDVQDKVIEDILLDPEYIDMANEMILKTAAGFAADTSGNAIKLNVIDTAGDIGSQAVDVLKKLNIDMSKIFSSVSGATGDIVVQLLPKEVQVAYSAMFSVSENVDLVGQVYDIYNSADNAYIRIFTPQENSKMTVEGVTVIDTEGALPDNALLQVTRMPTNEVFSVRKIGVKTEEYQLYDINYASDGIEVQPNGTVTVHLPIPANYDWEEYAVLHQQDDGSWEVVESRIENDTIVVEVDHFSLFAIIDGSAIKHRTEANFLVITVVAFAVFSVLSISLIVIIVIMYVKGKKHRNKGGRFLKK